MRKKTNEYRIEVARDLLENLLHLYDAYDLLLEIWVTMDRYHPKIDGKELDRDLVNRLNEYFGFDESE